MRKSALNIYKSIRSGDEGMADRLIESTLNEKAKNHLRNIIVNESPLDHSVNEDSMKEYLRLMTDAQKYLDTAEKENKSNKDGADQRSLDALDKALDIMNKALPKMSESVNEAEISMKDMEKLRKDAEKYLDKAQESLYSDEMDDDEAFGYLDKALANLNKMISSTDRSKNESKINEGVTGPFTIDQNDIDNSTTLEQEDLGKWYVLINGTYQFVKDENHGLNLVKNS